MNTPLKCGISGSWAYADSSKFVNGLSGIWRLNTRILTGIRQRQHYWCRVFYKETTQVYFYIYIYIYNLQNELKVTTATVATEQWCHPSSYTVILTLIAVCRYCTSIDGNGSYWCIEGFVGVQLREGIGWWWWWRRFHESPIYFSFTPRPSVEVMQSSVRDNIHSVQCFDIKECVL